MSLLSPCPRLFSIVLFCLLSGPISASSALVVDAGRLFDGERLIDDARMVVRDGRVVKVGPRSDIAAPEGAEMLDHRQGFVMPGLIAAHSHVGMVRGTEHGGQFYSRETVLRDLAQFQRYGVVAVNALGLNRPLFHELRNELRGPGHGGADLYGAGAGVGAVDGLPPEGAMGLSGDQVQRPETAEQAREAVRRMAEAGIDMLKVWVDSADGRFPKMPEEVYRAAIDEAQALGLPTAAHVHDLEDAKGVVRAGVDVVAHGVRDELVDEEFVTMVREQATWYVPTINLDEAEYIYAQHPEWLDDPFLRAGLSNELLAQIGDESWRAEKLSDADDDRQAVDFNLRNLGILHQAGVNIALGTDSGATALRIPGFAEHRELELMVQAGMQPIEALRSATSKAAQMMRLEDRGSLEAGSRADFLVLASDPTADIRATRSLQQVWRDGQLME
jgi:imidazolonepropionase-like amidohydrolase